MWIANNGDATVTRLPVDGVSMSATVHVNPLPYAVAFDGTHIWVAHQALGASPGSVTMIDPDVDGGAPVTFGGFKSPQALAFDGTNMWVADAESGNVYRLNLLGTMVGEPVSVGVGLTAMAFDGTNMWVTSYSSSNVSVVPPTGTTVGPVVSVGQAPYGLAFDGTNMWVAAANSNNVDVIPVGESPTVQKTFSVNGTPNPKGIAFDGKNMWVADFDAASVTKLSPNGTQTTFHVPTAGQKDPHYLAFDGRHMWVTLSTQGVVVEL